MCVTASILLIMNWIDVNKEKPSAGHFESVDVLVCCGSRTYSASFVKYKDESEGRFYLDLNFPKKIFENITEHVTHWMYVELPS